MKKILIVEDNVEIVQLFKNRLEANDFLVITAFDGIEGIDKARQENPDLIIMDVKMPNLMGVDAVRALQADPQTKNIPVIFITGIIVNDSAEEEVSKVNFFGKDFIVLSKPINTEKLISEIKSRIKDCKNEVVDR